MMEQIPRRLKLYREKAGLTLAEASDALGIHILDLIDYEKGKKLPDMRIIKKMSKLYDTTCDELLIF